MSDQELADLQNAVSDHTSRRDPIAERRKSDTRNLQRWAMFARSLCIVVTLMGLVSISVGAAVSQPVWILRGAGYAAVFAAFYFWSRRTLDVPVVLAAIIYAVALMTPADFHLRLLSGSILILATQWVLIAISLYGLWQHGQIRRALR